MTHPSGSACRAEGIVRTMVSASSLTRSASTSTSKETFPAVLVVTCTDDAATVKSLLAPSVAVDAVPTSTSTSKSWGGFPATESSTAWVVVLPATAGSVTLAAKVVPANSTVPTTATGTLTSATLMSMLAASLPFWSMNDQSVGRVGVNLSVPFRVSSVAGS